MQVVDSTLLSLEFFGNPVQLLTVEVTSDGTAIWKNLPMNNPIDAPPDAQHHLLGMRVRLNCCYACLTSAKPLTSVRIVNIQHPLLIISDKIAKPLVVAVRCY